MGNVGNVYLRNHTIIKAIDVHKKEIILKGKRESDQVTYKGRPVGILPDISTEILQAEETTSASSEKPSTTIKKRQRNISL